MNNKTVLAWGFIIIVLGGLIWWSKTSTATDSAAAKPAVVNNASGFLAASETFYDFGTISMKNGDVSHVFKVTNQTGTDIMVATLNTSCMCTSASIVRSDGSINGPFGMPGMGYVPPANELIKAGETRDIKVVYNPNAHGPAGVCAIDRFIYLKDAQDRTLQLEIKAVVTP